MSRIGKQPVVVPAGVEVSVSGRTITMKNSKGQTLETGCRPEVSLNWDESQRLVEVIRHGEGRRARAMHGLFRALIQNMVTGLTTGFKKELEIIGVGYNAKLQGNTLVLNIGFNAPVEMDIPEGLELEVPGPLRIIIKGADKQLVGQFAADVRSVRPPEPYKGKGIRYVDEYVRKKVGKAAIGAG